MTVAYAVGAAAAAAASAARSAPSADGGAAVAGVGEQHARERDDLLGERVAHRGSGSEPSGLSSGTSSASAVGAANLLGARAELAAVHEALHRDGRGRYRTPLEEREVRRWRGRRPSGEFACQAEGGAAARGQEGARPGRVARREGRRGGRGRQKPCILGADSTSAREAFFGRRSAPRTSTQHRVRSIAARAREPSAAMRHATGAVVFPRGSASTCCARQTARCRQLLGELMMSPQSAAAPTQLVTPRCGCRSTATSTRAAVPAGDVAARDAPVARRAQRRAQGARAAAQVVDGDARAAADGAARARARRDELRRGAPFDARPSRLGALAGASSRRRRARAAPAPPPARRRRPRRHPRGGARRGGGGGGGGGRRRAAGRGARSSPPTRWRATRARGCGCCRWVARGGVVGGEYPRDRADVRHASRLRHGGRWARGAAGGRDHGGPAPPHRPRRARAVAQRRRRCAALTAPASPARPAPPRPPPRTRI